MFDFQYSNNESRIHNEIYVFWQFKILFIRSIFFTRCRLWLKSYFHGTDSLHKQFGIQKKKKYCTYFAVTFELIRDTFDLFTFSDLALKIHGRFSFPQASPNKYVKRNLFFNSRYRRLTRVEYKSIVCAPFEFLGSFRAAVDLCTDSSYCHVFKPSAFIHAFRRR